MCSFIIRLVVVLTAAFYGSLSFSASPTGSDGGTRGAFSEPGGGRARSVSYSGATEIVDTTTNVGAKYASDTPGEVALLVSGGASTLENATIAKSGSPTGRSDDYDFYGVNAAALVHKGELTLKGGTITTDSAYSSGLFVYGEGKATAENVEIHTREHNSGGVMVTGGGTLDAIDLRVVTEGNSSAPIRSDRGGGLLTVRRGEYRANGAGSPAIYSTADIRVEDATLVSTRSEGAIIEGRNSIALKRTKLTDDNNVLHGKSTTYKNVFIYQSFSGDAAVGTSRFAAEDCDIATKKGDSIYVTNTSCVVELRNNRFVNEDPEGYFLRVRREGWGRKGQNGGKVALTLAEQEIEGNVYVDNISELTMAITEGSRFVGAINAENTAGRLDVTLDAESTLELTADSYVSSLQNADATGANVKLNGHKLYVGEEKTADNLPETGDAGNGRGGPGRPGGFGGKDGDRPEPPMGDGVRGENPSTGDRRNFQAPPEGFDGERPEPPEGIGSNGNGESFGRRPGPPPRRGERGEGGRGMGERRRGGPRPSRPERGYEPAPEQER